MPVLNVKRLFLERAVFTSQFIEALEIYGQFNTKRVIYQRAP